MPFDANHRPSQIQTILASLEFFERLPAADFPILHPVKVVSLRDLYSDMPVMPSGMERGSDLPSGVRDLDLAFARH